MVNFYQLTSQLTPQAIFCIPDLRIFSASICSCALPTGRSYTFCVRVDRVGGNHPSTHYARGLGRVWLGSNRRPHHIDSHRCDAMSNTLLLPTPEHDTFSEVRFNLTRSNWDLSDVVQDRESR